MKKNILLIGGSHGIGFEIALKLYREHSIFIASRTSENLGNLEVTHIPYDASTDEIAPLNYRSNWMVSCTVRVV